MAEVGGFRQFMGGVVRYGPGAAVATFAGERLVNHGTEGVADAGGDLSAIAIGIGVGRAARALGRLAPWPVVQEVINGTGKLVATGAAAWTADRIGGDSGSAVRGALMGLGANMVQGVAEVGADATGGHKY